MTAYDSANPAAATYQAGQPHPDPRDTHGHGASGHGPETHHIGLTTYLIIFAILMVLLVVTVGAAFVNFGHHVLNIVIAMGVAVVKTTVVVMYFMHVKYSSRLTQVFVVSGVFWLGILFVLLFGDYQTREALPSSNGWTKNLPASSEHGGGRFGADGGTTNLPANRSDEQAAQHERPADAPPHPSGGTGRRE
jgi:cytochrome c oxidase subunit IV